MGMIRDASIELDYGTFNRRARQAASGLASLGVQPGDGVAIMMRNEIRFPEASIAAGLLGAYVIPVNWHNLAEELAFILQDSGAKVLIVHADVIRRLGRIDVSPLNMIVVDTPAEVCDAYGLDREMGLVPEDSLNWDTWRASFTEWDGTSLLPPPVIFYTSGTTGRPKGVRRPPLTPEAAAVFADFFTRSFGFTGEHGTAEDVVTVVTGPIYHGAPNGHCLFSIRAGADVTILPRFDAEGLLGLIESRRVTHLNMVPIMFNRLLKLPAATRETYDHSSLRFVTHAAAPVSPAVKRSMIEWWGPIIHEYYGATEIGNVAFCSSEEWLAHPGTVGKAPPGYNIRILGVSGEELPPGEIGEVACRIENAPPVAYINDEQKTRELEAKPGFLAAGDVGYLDADGYLFLCDRSKDMVISGGVNIYPAQIESVLHMMPGIRDCAVFGIPDEEFGETLYAVVEKESGSRVDREAVLAHLRDNLPGYLVPRRIEFSDRLPREDSGKIFKRKLREPFWSTAGRTI